MHLANSILASLSVNSSIQRKWPTLDANQLIPISESHGFTMKSLFLKMTGSASRILFRSSLLDRKKKNR